MPGTCYIVATKDEDGFYEPQDFVQGTVEDAIEEALRLQDEDPACDPRVIQVILDPAHPQVIAQGLAKELEAAADMAGPGPFQNGVRHAIEHLQAFGTFLGVQEIEATHADDLPREEGEEGEEA